MKDGGTEMSVVRVDVYVAGQVIIWTMDEKGLSEIQRD